LWKKWNLVLESTLAIQSLWETTKSFCIGRIFTAGSLCSESVVWR
jgi:hypothetical protein